MAQVSESVRSTGELQILPERGAAGATDAYAVALVRFRIMADGQAGGRHGEYC
ncbi:hypothetical protein [Streptomyces sp. KR55]|uniref:hypothetical protein n=1 Tax=Streptomyces sp. KR55 TaxID=3457425 RepID=UPI003FD35928